MSQTIRRKTYAAEFKEQALRKVHERDSKTLVAIANELDLPLGTIKNWLKQSNPSMTQETPTSGSAATWNAAQRLNALTESHSLKDQALHAWCREHGVFAHQLQHWHSQFCAIDKPVTTAQDSALRQARQTVQKLERELHRKDKALAEAAALLVLQKKFQALWEGEDK